MKLAYWPLKVSCHIWYSEVGPDWSTSRSTQAPSVLFEWYNSYIKGQCIDHYLLYFGSLSSSPPYSLTRLRITFRPIQYVFQNIQQFNSSFFSLCLILSWIWGATSRRGKEKEGREKQRREKQRRERDGRYEKNTPDINFWLRCSWKISFL